jgi:hypothetical protein
LVASGESSVSGDGAGCGCSAGFAESSVFAFSASALSPGFASGAGEGCGAGVGVAFADDLVFELFVELDFFFVVAAGFFAESDFVLLVAACPLTSRTTGSKIKPRNVRMYETLNIGRRK